MARREKGNWTRAPMVPTYPEECTIAAARFLATVARRYVNDRANRREVDEAIEQWKQECAKRWGGAP